MTGELLEAGSGLARSIFDAMPSPIFLVDEDVRILGYNLAAGDLLSAGRTVVLQQRGGEALHCIHSEETPWGCGSAPACSDCVIRNSVSEAYRGGKTWRKLAQMQWKKPDGSAVVVQVLVTATPLRHADATLVLLALEDVSELMQLKRLVPICAHCRKIRDDDEYWQRVDVYFKRTLDINFTHGICPDCVEGLKAEMRSAVVSPRPGE